MKKILLMLMCMITTVACSNEEIVINGDIYGIVTDASNGEPIRNATVTLSPGNLATITGNDGHYEFTDIESGQYKVMASSTGYVTNTHQISIVSGKSATCDISLEKQTEISGLSVSSYLLNFGQKYKELVITLTNTSSSGVMRWNISNISKSWLTISETSGMLDIGESVDLIVTIDRSAISVDDELTFITVNANRQSATITIMVTTEGDVTADNSGSDNGSAGENGSDNSGSDDGSAGENGSHNSGSDDESNVNDTANPVSGLYAYYKFEGSSENSYGSAPDGISVGGSQYVDGVNGGRGLQFDGGDNSYLNIPESIIDVDRFSISFWVKGISDGLVFRVVPSSSARYTSISHALAMKDGLLKYSQSGYNWLYQYDNESKFPSFAHGSIDDSKWTMVTLTSDYNSGYGTVIASLYINAQLNDTVSLTKEGSTNGFGTKLIFGGGFANAHYLTLSAVPMAIDNLRIYNSRVLTAKEIKQIYEYEK